MLFPVVGAGVGRAERRRGAAALPVRAGAGRRWRRASPSSCVVTGALHVDALADTADAAGAQTRERALEIMRDSRIGSFGAAALTTDLLTRAAAIAGLVAVGGPVAALAAAGALGRAASLPVAAALPYARAEGGPGSVLTGRVGWLAAGGAVVIAITGAFVLTGVDGLWAAAGAAATALILALVFRSWLGGVTGDALGAVTELAGLVALLVFVAVS